MKHFVGIQNSRSFAPTLTVFFLLISSAAFAGPIKEIQLSDGSVIKGEIVSFADGVYHIKSDALGTFYLDDARVRSITTLVEIPPKEMANIASSETVYSNGINLEGQTGAVAGQILSDPETWRLIQKLQSDPSMLQILEDQELMRAIDQQDFSRLMSDPKFQELLRNETLGEILERTNTP